MSVSCSIEILLSSQMTMRLPSSCTPAIAEASAETPSCEVAVGGDHVDVVIEEGLAGGGVGVKQAALAARGHRHADGGREAGAERARGDLHARGVAVLGVTGGLRALGAQRLEVVEAHGVARARRAAGRA